LAGAEYFGIGVAVEQPGEGVAIDCVRKLDSRSCQTRFRRFLNNVRVTVTEIGQDRMQEQPDIDAIADRPEIVLALGLGLAIDLSRIANGQYMTTAHQAGGPLRRRPQLQGG